MQSIYILHNSSLNINFYGYIKITLKYFAFNMNNAVVVAAVAVAGVFNNY